MHSDSNYEILEELGKGSTTVVFRAFDRNLKRFVAIKSLREDASEIQKERFLQQARFLAGLSHPNVMNVHSLAPETGSMVMELLSGSLRDRIAHGKMNTEVACSVLKQALDGLGYLHGMKLVHGSVRPSNILIDESGKVKLSDFVMTGHDGAIAAPEPSLSKYVAPEIWDEAKFGPIGPSMDLYCLGITLLECINGPSLDKEVSISPGGQRSDVHWARWHTSPDHSSAIKRLVGNSLGSRSNVLCSMLSQRSIDRPKSITLLDAELSNVEFAPVAVESIEVSMANDKLRTISSSNENGSHFDFHNPKPNQNPLNSNPKPKPAWLPEKWTLTDKIAFRWALGAVVISTASIYSLYLAMSGIPKRELLIMVEPPNAFVTVEDSNGKSLETVLIDGRSTIQLPIGNYSLRAKADGYEAVNKDVTLEKSETKPKSINLKLPLTTIDVIIQTEPPDAEVFLGDKLLPRNSDSKIAFKPGAYDISIRKQGFVPGVETIVVSPTTATFKPKPLLAIVKFLIKPDRVTVTGDNIELRPLTANSSEFALPTGQKTFEFRKDGFETLKQSCEIVGGATFVVQLKEVPKPVESMPDKQTSSDSKSAQGQIAKPQNNSIGLELIWCPPGTFQMGSPAGKGEDNEHGPDGGTIDTTISSGFWMSRTEITQSQWKLVMETEPWSMHEQAKRGDDYAASYISRGDAITYCRRLTAMEKGNGNLTTGQYRLPTEAEWEFACRGGTKTRFSFGDQAQMLKQYGWFDENGHNTAAFHAQRVGQMKPNPLGIFDMHGNVWEWCLDAYSPKLSGGENPLVRQTVDLKNFVVRGGSWYGSASDARSARRGFEAGEVRATGAMGFRVVLSIE